MITYNIIYYNCAGSLTARAKSHQRGVDCQGKARARVLLQQPVAHNKDLSTSSLEDEPQTEFH